VAGVPAESQAKPHKHPPVFSSGNYNTATAANHENSAPRTPSSRRNQPEVWVHATTDCKSRASQGDDDEDSET